MGLVGWKSKVILSSRLEGSMLNRFIVYLKLHSSLSHSACEVFLELFSH
jgi:hypothetical protein